MSEKAEKATVTAPVTPVVVADRPLASSAPASSSPPSRLPLGHKASRFASMPRAPEADSPGAPISAASAAADSLTPTASAAKLALATDNSSNNSGSDIASANYSPSPLSSPTGLTPKPPPNAAAAAAAGRKKHVSTPVARRAVSYNDDSDNSDGSEDEEDGFGSDSDLSSDSSMGVGE